MTNQPQLRVCDVISSMGLDAGMCNSWRAPYLPRCGITVLLHKRRAMDVPVLDGIHHIKFPATDLDQSRNWYTSRLGYQLGSEFVEQGVLMGIGLVHPAGGPDNALHLGPERSAGLGDFDFFSIGVPDKASNELLAERLTGLGEAHAGVYFAGIGWTSPLDSRVSERS